jgi:transcriptional regulator GlxA family with amidase domain
MFEIDIERKVKTVRHFYGSKHHGDEVVLKAQELIENNPTATFTVDEVCDKSGVGRRTFEDDLKGTGNSIVNTYKE